MITADVISHHLQFDPKCSREASKPSRASTIKWPWSFLLQCFVLQEFGDITTKEAVLHVAYTSVVQEPEASGGLRTLE